MLNLKPHRINLLPQLISLAFQLHAQVVKGLSASKAAQETRAWVDLPMAFERQGDHEDGCCMAQGKESTLRHDKGQALISLSAAQAYDSVWI